MGAVGETNTKILLVEDDEDDYILTKESLEELKGQRFELFWVTDHQQAITELAKGEYDLCLLDHRLGEVDGLDVLKIANQQLITTPIIMLTGQADEYLDQKALEAGAQDFLSKSDLSSARFDRAVRYALNRKEIEIARLERQKAEANNRSKDRFIAHLSHELRTPLTSILGYTELLLESSFAGHAVTELNIILNNGKHLLSLLNDVLDLSKITANKLELRPGKVFLDSFLADVYTLMKVSAIDKGLLLEISSSMPIPTMIRADSTRLRQILINLINNAIKFTDEGVIKVSLSTEFKGDQEFLLIKVIDTGIGISETKLNHIFLPFEQLEDLVNRKEGGAGLGLAISSELAYRMGGKISVQSQENVGSHFTLELPIDELSAKRAFLNFETVKVNKREVYKPKLQGEVLIVDDLMEIRNLAGHIVKSTGASVTFAKNGQEALELIQAAKLQGKVYSLILMDLHMPVMNGRDAVVAMRTQGYLSPIVAMTAAMQQGIKDELLNIGFDNVIPKPINKSVILKELSHYLVENLPKHITDNLTEPDQVDQVSEKADDLSCLLVEDDKDSANLMRLLLQKLNVTVVVVHSATDCLKAVETNKAWDLILVDLGLPDMNGLQLIQKLQLLAVKGKYFILSGETPAVEALDGLSIERTLLKPINMSHLVEITQLQLK